MRGIHQPLCGKPATARRSQDRLHSSFFVIFSTCIIASLLPVLFGRSTISYLCRLFVFLYFLYNKINFMYNYQRESLHSCTFPADRMFLTIDVILYVTFIDKVPIICTSRYWLEIRFTQFQTLPLSSSFIQMSVVFIQCITMEHCASAHFPS